MGSAEHAVPGTVAFEDAGTRAAWIAERRRVRIHLACLAAAWVVFFLVLTTLDSSGVIALSDVTWSGRRGRGGSNLLAAVNAVALLVCGGFACRHLIPLQTLKRVRRVLEAHPWRPVTAVQRLPRKKDTGVPVRLLLEEGGAWTRDLSTRGARPRRQWPEALERGAWHAGDLEGTGVLALPGGGRPMEIRVRGGVIVYAARADRGSAPDRPRGSA
ncbi:hypothetical protein [Streptomyces catenulae]|uniref:PH domain-containing protein n=1 Tax=Streptomyces catenulae TaxID=66875 RepID=A0ABV2YVB1_9ACTN|nr:hypothetical protein [Streptomyces catenulae]